MKERIFKPRAGRAVQKESRARGKRARLQQKYNPAG
jgi:hypothetical protein